MEVGLSYPGVLADKPRTCISISDEDSHDGNELEQSRTKPQDHEDHDSSQTCDDRWLNDLNEAIANSGPCAKAINADLSPGIPHSPQISRYDGEALKHHPAEEDMSNWTGM